jgi:hypothetical protein
MPAKTINRAVGYTDLLSKDSALVLNDGAWVTIARG